jgi:hypothetical protein
MQLLVILIDSHHHNTKEIILRWISTGSSTSIVLGFRTTELIQIQRQIFSERLAELFKVSKNSKFPCCVVYEEALESWKVSLPYQLSVVRSFWISSDSSETGQWPYLFKLNKKYTGVTSICGSTALRGPWTLFQCLNLHTVGRTSWTWDQPLRTVSTHTQNNTNTE